MLKTELSVENPWYLPYDQAEQDFLTKLYELLNKQKATAAQARQEEKAAYQKLQAEKEAFNYERALVNIYRKRLGMATQQIEGTAQSKPARSLAAELSRKRTELNIVKQRLHEVDLKLAKVQKKRPKLFDPSTVAHRRLQIHLFENKIKKDDLITKLAGEYPIDQTQEADRFKATFSEQKRALWQNYIETHSSIISRLRAEIDVSSQRIKSTRYRIENSKEIGKKKEEGDEKKISGTCSKKQPSSLFR